MRLAQLAHRGSSAKIPSASSSGKNEDVIGVPESELVPSVGETSVMSEVTGPSTINGSANLSANLSTSIGAGGLTRKQALQKRLKQKIAELDVVVRSWEDTEEIPKICRQCHQPHLPEQEQCNPADVSRVKARERLKQRLEQDQSERSNKDSDNNNNNTATDLTSGFA